MIEIGLKTYSIQMLSYKGLSAQKDSASPC